MKVEEQLLPSPALKPAYDRVVWLYVFRDFSNKPADKAAERVSLRFGLTSWPQHLLVDPGTLQVIGDTGRSVRSFLTAVARARVAPRRSARTARLVEQAEQRATEIEEKQDIDLAKKYLTDRDILVSYRALQVLADKEPKAVADQAAKLLGVPNDPFRYEVCAVLEKDPNPAAKRALEALAVNPRNSKNPNVLRIRAVEALAACGDAQTVKLIWKFSQGSHLNGLTGTAVDALAAIAKRHPKTRDPVRDVLIQAYPKPPPSSDKAELRICTALARRVHDALGDLTGKSVPFPEVYTATDRDRLIQVWSLVK